MFLDPRIHTDYDAHINPYIRNGIIIDACIVREIIDGTISARITKKESPELNKILKFLDIIKCNNKWNKFFITPHVLTEVCQHVREEYKDWQEPEKILNEIMPILKDMGDQQVSKGGFLGIIEDKKHLAIEAGDISIFVATNDFLNQKEKIAILSNDGGINHKYEFDNRVMVMDYNSFIQNV